MLPRNTRMAFKAEGKEQRQQPGILQREASSLKDGRTDPMRLAPGHSQE